MYDNLIRSRLSKPNFDHTLIPCVTPRWDNSPRREQGATIFLDSTPTKYGAWLSSTVQRMEKSNNPRDGDCDVIFVNAWNEWAEGAHLEPDRKWDRRYLEATRDVICKSRDYPRESIGKLSEEKYNWGFTTRFLAQRALEEYQRFDASLQKGQEL